MPYLMHIYINFKIGDSGGPLMGDDKTNKKLPFTYLAGIVSRGPQDCGTPGYPAIYTVNFCYLLKNLIHIFNFTFSFAL